MSKVNDNRNCIAFKLNYCDGGRNDERIGFDGSCSYRIRSYNIEKAKHSWCTNEDCICYQYWCEDISKEEFEEEDYPCTESAFFDYWEMYAGCSYDGANNPTPRKINGAEPNHLCVLTTKLPNMQEKDRFIFAMYLISNIEPNNEAGDCVHSNEKYRLEFRPNEAIKMKFWKYYQNPNYPNTIKWGSGLFRYFTDDVAIQFLRMAVEIKKGTLEEKFAKEFLNYYCNVDNK